MARKMKDSGIEWIGEIPEDWGLPAAKYHLNIFNGSNPSEEGEVPVYGSGEGVFRYSKEYKLGPAVLLGRKGTIEKPKYIEGKYWNVDTAFNVYSEQTLNLKFYFYLSKIFDYKQYITSTALPSMTKENYQNMKIPYPDIIEQKAIVAYLDKKCCEVESVSNQIKQEIETLENYKKSLITEAVTKGLDRNVEMKDSGIDWIGEIPKNWKTIKLKLGLSEKMKYGANEQGVEFSNELPRYVRITDITENNRLKEQEKLSLPEEKSVGYILKDKTVLFARSGATVGKTFFYKSSYGRAAFAGYLISAKTNKRILLEKWLYYFTMTHSYAQWINQIYSQSTIQNISAEKYSNMELPITNIENQKNIINYLNKKTKLIDQTIALKQKQVQALEEYKKSLIYEYVTGKKEAYLG